MRKVLLLILLCFLLNGCVATVITRGIVVKKDANGKIIGYEEIEMQQQQTKTLPFVLKHIHKLDKKK